ncbi:MAG: RNA-binding protein [Chloroflexi bacterium]|nr:RNA-binding protein [Chloroflexota bacterium]
MEKKLYVGNLSYSTTEDDLRTLFAKAGELVSVAVIKDRDTNRSKGFGFVEMGTQAEAQKAISMFNAYALDGRNLTVNLARPREERSSGGSTGGYGNRGGGFGGREKSYGDRSGGYGSRSYGSSRSDSRGRN